MAGGIVRATRRGRKPKVADEAVHIRREGLRTCQYHISLCSSTYARHFLETKAVGASGGPARRWVVLSCCNTVMASSRGAGCRKAWKVKASRKAGGTAANSRCASRRNQHSRCPTDGQCGRIPLRPGARRRGKCGGRWCAGGAGPQRWDRAPLHSFPAPAPYVRGLFDFWLHHYGTPHLDAVGASPCPAPRNVIPSTHD
jgi:hypothetical protein